MRSINRQNLRTSVRKLGLPLAAFALASFFIAQACADPTDLYVTDLATGSVIRYAQDQTATTFASGLISPQGIVFDQASNTMPAFFYVADAGDGGATSGVIYRYDRAGNRTTFATNLNNPIGLALDGEAVIVGENGADRIQRLPINGSPGTISLLIPNPLGLDTKAFEQSGFRTKFVATGDSVFKVDPGSLPVDIDPDDVSRSVSVDPLAGDAYVSTEAGTIVQIPPDGSPKSIFASGLTDPRGLAFVPPGVIIGQPGLVYVAETAAGTISRIAPGGTPEVFVSGAGQPNYLVFETQSDPDPSPTPTPTPTPTPSPTPIPTPTPAGHPLNISTRVDVETGDNVGIGGFIISGTDPKLVVIRAIGPSLSDLGISNPLSDPLLELHDENGLLTTNDNWMGNTPEDQTILTDNKLAPSNDLEAAIVMTLNPGKYTAIIKGSNGATGVALVEVYDLDDPSTEGELLNISTRGLVGTGENVLIAGVIVGPTGGADASVVVRAIGPSLPVANPLIDPVLELHNSDGDKIATNDNWETDSAPDNYSAEVIAAMLEPPSAADSAIFANLLAGSYTAIVTGKDGTGGVALVEVYHVPAQMTQSSSP